MVSMSKGGGGGRGSVTIPSQRPWRRRVEDQIIAEGVDGGDGSEFAVGER
jgi:hypothetical protein